jgi:PhoD-like phosphatase
MQISRREFLAIAVTGAATTALAGCSSDDDGSGAPAAAPGPDSLSAPQDLRATPENVGSNGGVVAVSWSIVDDALSYDVELNGSIVATSNPSPSFDIGQGNGRTGLSAGANTVRVRGRAGELEGTWSEPQTYTVTVVDVIRARGFDAEDDGPIEVTVAPEETSVGTALVVGSAYAFGEAGKGAALVCSDPTMTKAYKNHGILPVDECWVRVSFSPRTAQEAGKRIQLARINASSIDDSERLFWVTGTGITSTSVKVEAAVPDGAWVQVQLGVYSDGKVELWAFDGTRETLLGTGASTLVGPIKDKVSFGNHNPNIGQTFEAWLDDFAVGESRLPWVRPQDTRALYRPLPLVPADLPDAFTFVFGSCTNSNHVPAHGTALAVASASNPDFVFHLGDLGYLDSSAYAQSTGGYLASWSDLAAGSYMSVLASKPWITMCSDHDLGGNNIVAATVAPHAVEAFVQYHSNDRSVDGLGGYGAVPMDEGRVLLVWTEGVLYRSALDAPDAPDNTKLGPEQREWLLQLLGTTSAQLVILGSETTFGHQSRTSWVQYPAERQLVLDALAACPGQVRILSGDMHHAHWARLAENVVEWGAAAMAEFPEGRPLPAAGVLDSGSPGYKGYRSRNSALEALTIPEFNASTTYGWASIDTTTHTARFELRRSDDTVWHDDRDRPMAETFQYA